jgi:drug/metabolite transporter (DMT)-like permease
VRGKAGEPESHPATRIRNTRKVLIAAALLMSTYLFTSVLITTLLIPPNELVAGGRAANRALAYLAHGAPLTEGGPLLPCCGIAFGTMYDAVTILVLCLAGTSVMTGLSLLLPHFLSRFGMEFRWARKWGIMLALFAVINLLVTVWFKASVDAQRGAYATAVLVLIAAAAIATLYDKRKIHDHHPRQPVLFWLGWSYYAAIAIIFVLVMLGTAAQSRSGLAIALCFIVSILAMSVLSRALRADEMRTIGFDFINEESKFLWDSLCLADFPVLVPHRPGRENRTEKQTRIRAEHQLAPDVDLVFLEVEVDDPSNFYQQLLIEVMREEGGYVIRVRRCVSVPHAIAAIALEMSRSSIPPGVHFGWPELDMLSASWSYLAFGEGNIPWKVRELIHRLQPDPVKRPRVVVG